MGQCELTKGHSLGQPSIVLNAIIILSCFFYVRHILSELEITTRRTVGYINYCVALLITGAKEGGFLYYFFHLQKLSLPAFLPYNLNVSNCVSRLYHYLPCLLRKHRKCSHKRPRKIIPELIFFFPITPK